MIWSHRSGKAMYPTLRNFRRSAPILPILQMFRHSVSMLTMKKTSCDAGVDRWSILKGCINDDCIFHIDRESIIAKSLRIWFFSPWTVIETLDNHSRNDSFCFYSTGGISYRFHCCLWWLVARLLFSLIFLWTALFLRELILE